MRHNTWPDGLLTMTLPPLNARGVLAPQVASGAPTFVDVLLLAKVGSVFCHCTAVMVRSLDHSTRF